MGSRIAWSTAGSHRRRTLAAALVLFVAGGVLALAPNPARSVASASFTTVADAFVDKSQPNRNFGTGPVLRADDSPVRRSFVRFAVAGLPGAVTRARLRLYTTAANPGGFGVSAATGAWSEKAVTWASAPTPGPVVSRSPAAGSGQWVSFDATPLVPGEGTVNLAITSRGGAAAFASRESGAHAPELVVETGGPTTTDPATTTTTDPTATTTTTDPSATTTTTDPSATTTTTDPSATTTTTTDPTATTTTTAPAGGGAGCDASLTARQARYNVLGYLFGDGHWETTGYSYTARTACKVTRMRAAIQAAGIDATLTGGDKFHFAPVAPFDQPQAFGPSLETAAGVATADDLRYFLAGIIEGEGTGSGKVLDDPNWGRTAGVVELYDRMGVVVKPNDAPPECGCPTATGFWGTFVDPSAPTAVYNGYIAIIRSWPFAEMGRVPKFR